MPTSKRKSMTAKTLANHYAQLSAEERFRLIVAAGDRGDEVERERLMNASKRITLTMPDHAPMSDAFDELAELVFMELVEEAARYDNAFEHWGDHEMMDFIDGKKGRKAPVRKNGRTERESSIDLCLAHGFILRTKAAGWKLFCERRGLSYFGIWQYLPGFDRLQRRLKHMEESTDWPGPAFTPGDMVRWMNRTRPADRPEATEADLISAERFADDFDTVFRTRVEWWGG